MTQTQERLGALCFNANKVKALRASLPDEATLSQQAERFKAMGHPARLAILHLLGEQEGCVCDLANVLDIPVSTLSQHLKVLRQVGLVQARQQGRFIFYSRPPTPRLEAALPLRCEEE